MNKIAALLLVTVGVVLFMMKGIKKEGTTSSVKPRSSQTQQVEYTTDDVVTDDLEVENYEATPDFSGDLEDAEIGSEKEIRLHPWLAKRGFKKVVADITKIRSTVENLIHISPSRSYRNLKSINAAASYLEESFKEMGVKPDVQEFDVMGTAYKNIRVLYGDPTFPRIIIGAHYDSHEEEEGADNNASGVAVMMEIARLVTRNELKNIAVEFVAYSLGEPPYLKTKDMGSYHHAQQTKNDNANVIFMANLDCVGYYTDLKDQQYPNLDYARGKPLTGQFVAISTTKKNLEGAFVVKKVLESFSNIHYIPMPSYKPGMYDTFDHYNYLNVGYPAYHITNTCGSRNEDFRTTRDRIDTLNFVKMKELTGAISSAILKYDFNL